MFLLKHYLIKLDLSFLSLRFIFEQDVSIFAVLEISEIFLNNLGTLRSLVFILDTDRPEPYFFNLAASSEDFL